MKKKIILIVGLSQTFPNQNLKSQKLINFCQWNFAILKIYQKTGLITANFVILGTSLESKTQILPLLQNNECFFIVNEKCIQKWKFD